MVRHLGFLNPKNNGKPPLTNFKQSWVAHSEFTFRQDQSECEELFGGDVGRHGRLDARQSDQRGDNHTDPDRRLQEHRPQCAGAGVRLEAAYRTCLSWPQTLFLSKGSYIT